jgi:hypothetical protein
MFHLRLQFHKLSQLPQLRPQWLFLGRAMAETDRTSSCVCWQHMDGRPGLQWPNINTPNPYCTAVFRNSRFGSAGDLLRSVGPCCPSLNRVRTARFDGWATRFQPTSSTRGFCKTVVEYGLGLDFGHGGLNSVFFQESTSQAATIKQLTDSINIVKSARQPRLKLEKGRRAFGWQMKLVDDTRDRYLLSWHEMLKVSFNQSCRRTTASEQFCISLRTVRRIRAITARSVMEIQAHLLDDFARFCEAKRPDFAVCTWMWDETSHRLSVNVVPDTLTQQHSSTWQVMVCRCHIAVGWTMGIKLYREFIMPPVPLASNSSNHVYHGLFNSPLMKPLHSIVDRILKSAEVSCIINEADGHLGNEKLHFHKYALENAKPKPCLMEFALCQNHQTNLVVCDAVSNSRSTPGTGGKLLQNLYCTTMFLKMGGHFTRLLISVHMLATEQNMVEWIGSPTPNQLAASRPYGEELAAYMIDNLKHNSRQMSSDVRPGSVAHQHDSANGMQHVMH